jgi:hypothetical protein
MFTVTTEDGLVTDRCRIYNDLVFWNERKKDWRLGKGIVTTLREARAQGIRLKIPSDYVLSKHYQFHFLFKNENPHPISNIIARIELVDKEGKLPPRVAFDNSKFSVSEFVGKREFEAVFDIFCLPAELPDVMWFRIAIDYHFRGKAQPTKVISVRFRPYLNEFSTGM